VTNLEQLEQNHWDAMDAVSAAERHLVVAGAALELQETFPDATVTVRDIFVQNGFRRTTDPRVFVVLTAKQALEVARFVVAHREAILR
jgi:hypothetical protein